MTSEAATSVSLPSAPRISERDDQPTGDSFESLIDINAQGSTAQTSNSADRHPDLLPNASRPDRTPSAGENARTQSSQASSGRTSQTDSTAGPGTGIQKPAGGDASNTTHHHRTKHKDPTKDDQLAASTSDPSASSQATATPPAVAVPAPIAASLSGPAAPTATLATNSATASGATGVLPARAASATQIAPAGTGFNPAADTATAAATIVEGVTIPPDARQAAQTTAVQADGALAAAVAAATPAGAKTTAKTLDDARPGKTTAPALTGLQPGSTAADATVTPAASTSGPVQPPNPTPGDHKHNAADTDNAKTATTDTGTPATQPGAAAPQHPAATADAAAAAAQPQPGQPASGQPQGVNGALVQLQMQPAAATPPVPPQLNVALAAGAAVPLSGLAVQIAVTAQSGKSRFEIRLDPADLGRIDVRLDVDRQGRVTSHLTVDKPETLAMLRQDAPQLQRALQDAGLKTGDGGLQFSLRDQSSQGQNARDDSSRNARHLIVTEDDIVPVAAAGRSYRRILGSSGGLDIKV
uniref:flagellar hook-length control protein FliK n=1 Tax=Nitrobacter sp. TaxID=29420 RepID=UPI00399D5774